MQIPAVKSWVDFQRGGVITVDDDVLGIVARIKAIDDRLVVYYNEQSAAFDVVEHCLDGVDRLVMSVQTLDQRVVDRLLAADHWKDSNPDHVLGDDEDFAADIDRHNEAVVQELREMHRDKIMDAGERLAHALKLPLEGNPSASVFIERSPLGEDDQGGDQDRAE